MALLRKASKFPLYLLPSGTVVEQEGTVLYGIHPLTKERAIIDDKSIDFPTLGARRLHIDGKLFNLSKSVVNLHNLVKLPNRKPQLINSDGEYFTYVKQYKLQLSFHFVKSYKDFEYENKRIFALHVSGVHCVVEASKPPPPLNPYVGLLRYKYGYLFYGYYDQMYNTKRVSI